MDAQVVKHKQELQEEEYFLPVHWTLRKDGLTVYLFKTDLMAEMLRQEGAVNGKALDVGCGDGRGTYELSKRMPGLTFEGIDFSERAIAFARLMAPGIDFEVQTAQHIDAPDNTYDVVVSREVIEHIPPEDVVNFLLEIKRVLKPNGAVLFTTPSENRRIPPKHFQHFTESKVRAYFDQAGLTLTQIRGLAFFPPRSIEKAYRWLTSLPAMWRLKRYFGTRLPSVERADNLLFVGKKA